jgi:hypothetical protein
MRRKWGLVWSRSSAFRPRKLPMEEPFPTYPPTGLNSLHPFALEGDWSAGRLAWQGPGVGMARTSIIKSKLKFEDASTQLDPERRPPLL